MNQTPISRVVTPFITGKGYTLKNLQVPVEGRICFYVSRGFLVGIVYRICFSSCFFFIGGSLQDICSRCSHGLFIFLFKVYLLDCMCVLIWVFPKIGVPQNGWFINGKPY